ncbi:MAG: hypothetical protein HY721_15450 [Planctomycetes bacterium]|nr:hypothetical protein [Planctomycetota bacterium]
MASKPLHLVAFSALAVHGALFLWIAADHVAYPGFVETTEGDALQHIERAAALRPIYPEAGSDFIPLPYMPLYYLAAAPLYRATGDSFAGPRLLSAASALLAGALLSWVAWRESRSRAAAALAGAFFLSSYAVSDAYHTCALPDSFLLLWLVLGYCFLAYGRTRIHDAAWVACFCLAFWTKQHGAFFAALAFAYAAVLRANRLPRWALLAGFLLGGPAAYFLLGPLLGEGFLFHTLTVPGRWERGAYIALRRTAFVLTVLVPALCLLAAQLAARTTSLRERRVHPLAAFTLIALAATTASMMAAGSSNNHYLPFMAVLCPAAALGAWSLLERGPVPHLGKALAASAAAAAVMVFASVRTYGHGLHPIPTHAPAVLAAAAVAYGITRVRRLRAARPAVAAVALSLAHFGIAWYDPFQFLREKGFEEGLARLRSELTAIPGPVVWMPFGNVPEALTEAKLPRAPSWVSIEDIERQRAPAEEVAATLRPLRESLRAGGDLFVLTNEALGGDTRLETFEGQLVLVKDYGKDFAGVRQIAYHWYSGRGFPRYLYRRR